MSQSATLYSISATVFRQLELSQGTQQFDPSSAKIAATFQGSSMGLEYVLSKDRDALTISLIAKVFNPEQFLNLPDFEHLTPEEQFELYENNNFIPYLDTVVIAELDAFLNTVSEAEIQSKYDSKELNANGIYPRVWHDNNAYDQAYNKRHILEDFQELKAIIKNAHTAGDFIIVFVA